MVNGHYRYMADLLSLEATATGQGPTNFCPATPLVVTAWQKALRNHPDRTFVAYILNGITKGFHIGAVRSAHITPSRNNLPSVYQHPRLISSQIETEVHTRRVLGPLPPHLANLTQTSPIGLIPKPHQPGKWRLIVDLSFPNGSSVNDAIPVDLCHLHYASVQDAASLIRQLGVGTLLAKLDVQQAYRIVPVHPDDHHLLGMCWEGQVYIDTALPFGLRSAPKIFSALADALAWILHDKGVHHQLHYLDDFLLLGAPQSPMCKRALDLTLMVCQELGVPIAPHKTEGPSPKLTFLGIQIDSSIMELSLPPDKLIRITHMVLQWRDKQVASKRELMSLIGTLSHAATVVLPGRTFLRRMIETMKIPKFRHHHVRLNTEFRSDIQWWSCFLPQWNGRSILPPAQASYFFTSDASGSWGCGAVSDSAQWFQVEWPPSWHALHISAKEMVPVVIAAAIWGPSWRSTTVRAISDNMAVVCALSSGSARDPLLMHLLRCLHFFTAHWQISIEARHIAGASNTAADALSRNKHDVFLSCVPQAPSSPSPIPQSLLDMLLHNRPDWTSSSWRRMFLSTLGKL